MYIPLGSRIPLAEGQHICYTGSSSMSFLWVKKSLCDQLPCRFNGHMPEIGYVTAFIGGRLGPLSVDDLCS